MQALSSPLLLVAPALHAGEAKHSLSTLGHQQQPQPQLQLQLLLHSHRCHLPLAQLEQIEAVEEPSSSALVHAPKLTDFTLVGLGLLLLFWLANFIVPDYIFKDLFGPETGNDNGDKSDDKQRVLDALVGGQNSSSPASSSTVEEGTTTFGQPSKPVKGRKERK